MLPYEDDKVDFWFTAEGDICVGADGDLKSTEYSPKRSLIQEVRTRISSFKGDWESDKQIGANLDSFIGKPSSDVMVSDISRALATEIYRDGLTSPDEASVYGLHLGRGIMIFRIIIVGYEDDVIEYGYSTNDGILRGF